MTTTHHTTACALDCPDACSLRVTVKGGRIVRVDADHEAANPSTAGWMCAKVKQTPELIHGADRITRPLIRSGAKGSGSFEEASWDDALDLIASRLSAVIDNHGPESIVAYLYNSSAGMMARDGLSNLVWEKLGAARTDITICAATSGLAWSLTYGELLSADPLDCRSSELVVVWGANPHTSNSHLAPVIQARRRAGAKLIVVDPRRIQLATRADLHVAVRPGTDVVLAMALAHQLVKKSLIDEVFVGRWVKGADEYLAQCEKWTPDRAADVCGVSAAAIEQFAELYGTIRPAMLRVGWGLERNQNGGSGTRAVLGLAALAGQFGQLGSGVILSPSAPGPYDSSALRSSFIGESGGVGAKRRAINMNRLGRTLTEGEGGSVHALFVQGSNPAATCPQQHRVVEGLQREDLFTIVHDLTMTDTATLADVVLPATSQFEADDIVASYGDYVVQDAPAVIPRVGESRTNDEVSTAIGIRLGLDPTVWRADSSHVRKVAMGDRCATVRTRPEGGSVQFRDVFTEAIHLAVEAEGVDRLPVYRPRVSDFPITLISPATGKTISTMFGSIRPASADLRLHPDDARHRGLEAGDLARVTDGRLTLEVRVAIGRELRPGVASMPKGMWRRDGHEGLTVNAFAPDDLSDLAGGATFNDARVEVTRVDPRD